MGAASPFMNAEEQTRLASDALASEEETYELAMQRSRAIIRKTKTAIHGLHNGRRDAELIDSISSDLAGLEMALEAHPRILFGPHVEDAMMEFAETVIYDYALLGQPLPSYTDLDVTPSAWVSGLGDAVGELRRDMVTALMEGRRDDAVRIFKTMEELSDALMTLDVKDSVAPVRRKQDVCRGLMEKSRSELATARIMSGD